MRDRDVYYTVAPAFPTQTVAMSTVFLSYSREDLSRIEQIAAKLKSYPEISIWRYQEKLYGGQKWPKVLGEAIADQDIFLLAWSKNAADSHFVEFEWTTALALKKVIVPCLLDGTPLPFSLAAMDAISGEDFPKIVTALTGASLTEDAGRRSEIISKLGQIKATKSEEVLQAAKTLFDQQSWTVQGNVIQGENVTVQMGEGVGKPIQGFLEKWQTWVGIIVGVLTAVTLAIELPNKMESAPKPVEMEKPKLQPLSGAIRSEANDPLPDVQVSLPQFNLTRTTDQFGHFLFEVTASEQHTVALLAQKSGYQTYETDVTLGNTSLGFTMRKKP